MHFEKASQAMVELFDSVCPSGPGIERKKMFGYPCYFVNGYLAGGLHNSSLILHLGEADRTELSKLGAEPYRPLPNRVMKEYVALPESILKDRKLLASWIDRSVTYCASLPEKPKKR